MILMETPERNLTSNFKILVEYDGSPFVGWQRQGPEAGASVQGLLEEALGRVLNHPVTLHGSGRTDAGVHARAQAASFLTNSPRRPEQLVRGVNCLLPPEIAVLSARAVPPNFHARFSATGKIYTYEFLASETRSALLARRAFWVGPGLDWARATAALPALLGRHDFAAFRSLGVDLKSTVRTLRRAELSRPAEHLWRLTLEGDGFLRHMVRAIAGTVWLIGRGKMAPEALPALIASKDRAQAGPNAPAHGLYLDRVLYGD